jgi:L-gulono-1,4-lactone dehydrogenase
MRSRIKPVSTYNDIMTFMPRRVVECESVNDVVSAVVDAASSDLKIRPCGLGYSWAPHIKTAGVSVNLLRLNRIHDVDKANKTIVVDAGVRLRDVSSALAANGLSLPSLSFISDVTIGGAVATGTHGTSPKWGTLSDSVISMDVVLASGKVRTFGPRSQPEELFAARTAIGMLGVIVRLELQAIPMSWVRFSELKMDLSTFRTQLPSILAKYDHVWAHWRLRKDTVRVECLESQTEPAAGFHRYVDGWRPPSNFVVGVLNRYRGRAGDIWRHMRRQVRSSMQYGVPSSQLEATINLIQASSFSATHPDGIVELKFLRGKGDSYLGPNADGDAVLFNMFWLADKDESLNVFDQFEHTMRSIHARPHWGKLHRAPDVEYMKLSYPGWSQFRNVQAKFDPNGAFSIFPRQRVVMPAAV